MKFYHNPTEHSYMCIFNPGFAHLVTLRNEYVSFEHVKYRAIIQDWESDARRGIARLIEEHEFQNATSRYFKESQRLIGVKPTMNLLEKATNAVSIVPLYPTAA